MAIVLTALRWAVFALAAMSATGLVALWLRGRRRQESDGHQVILNVIPVPRASLEEFRAKRPDLLTVEELLRWLDIRGLGRYRQRVQDEASRVQRDNPDGALLAYLAAVTRYGYVSSGREDPPWTTPKPRLMN